MARSAPRLAGGNLQPPSPPIKKAGQGYLSGFFVSLTTIRDLRNNFSKVETWLGEGEEIPRSFHLLCCLRSFAAKYFLLCGFLWPRRNAKKNNAMALHDACKGEFIFHRLGGHSPPNPAHGPLALSI